MDVSDWDKSAVIVNIIISALFLLVLIANIVTIWYTRLAAIAAKSSADTVGKSGILSCSADKISTRLIESIPRSLSRFISRFSISTG